MLSLDVYLHEQWVGELLQNEQGKMVFKYTSLWIVDPKACAISISLPLQEERFSLKACRPFFAGLLPEESKRVLLGRNLGVSAQNDFAILERIGGECAGAVTLLPKGHTLSLSSPQYRRLAADDIVEILKQLPLRPLMAGEQDVRLSLAGAQDKVPVFMDDSGGLSLPLGSSMSSHILKPAIEAYNGTVYNEAFCMQLAQQIGLNVAPVAIGYSEFMNYLLVKRYDRFTDKKNALQRLHQEDFCQALGVVSEMKYQSEGGPTLTNCFNLLRQVSASPAKDLQHLLDAVLFNVIIGNNDAHGKNFSLLYEETGAIRLAPLYDLLSTDYYPKLTKNMAMKIGKESKSVELAAYHLERFALDVGFSKSGVRKRMIELLHLTRAALPKVERYDKMSDDVAAHIQTRCELFISNFK